MQTQILMGKEARDAMFKGVEILYKAVSCTLGANGKTVIIHENNTIRSGVRAGQRVYPRGTKDGVTVAKNVVITGDQIANSGALLARQAAEKTVDTAGDGTTTCIVLLYEMIRLGMEEIDKGANPIQLKNDMEFASKKAIELLSQMARKTNMDLVKIEQIANVAANGDTEISQLITQIIKDLGEDASVIIEETQSRYTTKKYTEGYELNNMNWINHHFVTDQVNHTCVMEDCLILITDQTISDQKEIIPILSLLVELQDKNKKLIPLLIVAQDVEGEALAILTANKSAGKLLVCPVRNLRMYGDKSEIMYDLATLTGANVIAKDKFMEVKNATLADLGYAKKVVVGRFKTQFLKSGGKKENIEDRIKNLKLELAEPATPEYNKEQLKWRLGMLQQKMAIIYVGGQTEFETKERKDRVDDAVQATFCAIQDGYIAGGGMTLLRIGDMMFMEHNEENKNLGNRVIRMSLMQPFRKILENSGYFPDTMSQISEFVLGQPDIDFSYNCKTKEYEYFFETGIIDALTVHKAAIENATSIATQFLTMESVIEHMP